MTGLRFLANRPSQPLRLAAGSRLSKSLLFIITEAGCEGPDSPCGLGRLQDLPAQTNDYLMADFLLTWVIRDVKDVGTMQKISTWLLSEIYPT